MRQLGEPTRIRPKQELTVTIMHKYIGETEEISEYPRKKYNPRSEY